MLEKALRTYLLTLLPVTAIVDDRIHVGDQLFSKPEDLPALTIDLAHITTGFHRGFGSRLEQLDGDPVELQFPQYDIVSHGSLWETSIALCALVRRGLQPLSLGGTIPIVVDGATVNVVIDQVDVLAEWDEPEEHIGHGNTNKPRALRIRVGWRENVADLP